MSQGILIKNSSGVVTFDSRLSYVKFYQRINYTLPFTSNWLLTISVPGVLADGTWYGTCGISTINTVHYIKSMSAGQVVIHAPFGGWASGNPVDCPGYLNIMRIL